MAILFLIPEHGHGKIWPEMQHNIQIQFTQICIEHLYAGYYPNLLQALFQFEQ